MKRSSKLILWFIFFSLIFFGGIQVIQMESEVQKVTIVDKYISHSGTTKTFRTHYWLRYEDKDGLVNDVEKDYSTYRETSIGQVKTLDTSNHILGGLIISLSIIGFFGILIKNL